MNTLVAIAITLLAAYTVTLCVVGRQIPDSLSQSVFNLPPSGAWLWTVVLYTASFLTVPTYIDHTNENTKWLAFLAIVGLLFVGAAPLVKDKSDLAYKVHCGAAILCAVCSQLVLTFNCPWLLLCWVPFVAYLVCSLIKHQTWRTRTFWAEMVCFASTFAFCLTT
jgi:hypothetical protein